MTASTIQSAAAEIYRGFDIKLHFGIWTAVNADGNTVSDARTKDDLFAAVDAYKRAARAVSK